MKRQIDPIDIEAENEGNAIRAHRRAVPNQVGGKRTEGTKHQYRAYKVGKAILLHTDTYVC